MPVDVWMLEEFLEQKQWWVVAKINGHLVGANTKELITKELEYCQKNNPYVKYRMRQLGGPAHIAKDQLF
jgi:hypothetical protein